MITDYLKAGSSVCTAPGSSVLRVRTHELERFIKSACQQANGRTHYQWNVVRGFGRSGWRSDQSRPKTSPK